MMKYVCLFTFAVAPLAHAADWSAPKKLDVVQLCGTLEKTKTMYDGVQSVFTETDAKGKGLRTYFLAGVGANTVKQLESQEKDKASNVCVVGVRSLVKPIDSAPPFHTLEVLW